MSQNLSGTRSTILFAFTATILLVLLYLSINSNQSTKQTIHIGISQWPGHEYLFIAHKLGFLNQDNIDIELVELSSLTGVRRAFQNGKVDGMAARTIEVLEAYKRSNRIAKIVLTTDYSNGADTILSNPPIHSIHDLKGKKIGIEIGSSSSYLANRALQKNNIRKSEVILEPLDLHEMIDCLRKGDVDAVAIYPPSSITAKKLLRINQIFDSSNIPGEILNVIAIDKDTLTKHPNVKNILQNAWNDALLYASANPEQAYETLIERSPITSKEFKDSMNHIDVIEYDEQPANLASDGAVIKNFRLIAETIFKNPENNIDYTIFLYDQNQAQ